MNIVNKTLLFAVLLSFVSCKDFRLNSNSPSPISRGSVGPEIRLHPNSGAPDYKKMFTNPEQWAEARSKISVFQFHHGNTFTTIPCPLCLTPNGDSNSYQDLVGVNAFQKLNEWGIPASIEVGALKPHNCHNPETDLMGAVDLAFDGIRNIESSGGRVIDISMDEPFMGGTRVHPFDMRGCTYTPEEAALFTYEYWIKPIQRIYPGVQIGLTEAYPAQEIHEIKRNITALENLGYKLPFLHIDFDLNHGVNANYNPRNDMQELQRFLRDRNIIFGIIIWGAHGTSTQEWFADAEAMAFRFHDALGSSPDRIIIESWSEFGPIINEVSPRWYPELLPETMPGTMTYMVNQMSLLFR